MMKTITIELLNKNVLKILQQLEELKLLRFVGKKEPKSSKDRQWAGSISKETATKMLEHVEQSRNEWERDF